jgi:hypothetical protein
MRLFTGAGPALTLALCLGATMAQAATIDFSGSLTATASVAPDAGCAPAPLRGTISRPNSSGLSSLGAFTYSHAVCITGGTGPVTGVFSVFFDADQFDGTLIGQAVAAGDGTFNQVFHYTITGGVGRFAGGTGTFRGDGTVNPLTPPPRIDFAFTPTNSAVPEPATWATMLLGFVAVGAGLRRSRRRSAPFLSLGTT